MLVLRSRQSRVLHTRGHPINLEVPSEGLYFQRVVDTVRIRSITCQKRGSHSVDAGVKPCRGDSSCWGMISSNSRAIETSQVGSASFDKLDARFKTVQASGRADRNVKFSA